MNTAKKLSEAMVEPQAATSAQPLPQNPAPEASEFAPRRASQRSEKAPEAFRTISEVAAEIGEEPHVLRFWETKFPSLRPTKRAGGRRYYRPEDIEVLKRIQKLLRVHNFHIK
ncbi:MAG: MerR family transcriptional regulator, partial [Alphaproteobacteria bacterium]|nr:MerR family transcriptional regulator [Alphaproteobacteria bacterium]